MKVKDILKNVGKGALAVTAAGLAIAVEVLDGVEQQSNKQAAINGYSEAVNAVVNSSMFTDSKDKILKNMTSGLNTETYKAIVAIVNSDMFDNSKVSSILKIIENESNK